MRLVEWLLLVITCRYKDISGITSAGLTATNTKITRHTVLIVMLFVNTRYTSYSQPPKVHHAGESEEVYVGTDPSTVKELPKIVRSFVVSADKHCRNGSLLFP